MPQAVEFVIQQEAMLAMSKARKLSPTDGSAGKVTPLAELIELMETYGESELPQQEKVTHYCHLCHSLMSLHIHS